MDAPPSRPGGLLRKILLYGASRGVTEALLGTRGLLLASLLGPEAFGGWALFRLVARYGAFAGLGANRGLERELGGAHGGRAPGPADSEDRAARTTLGFTLAIFGVLSAAALLASFWVDDPWLALGMRGFAAAIVTEQILAYALIYLRSRGELRRYAKIEVASAALHLILAGLFALRWGLGGAFAGFALASAGSLVLVWPHVPFRPALEPRVLRRLLRVGFPLVLTMIISTSLATADRWVVAAFGGTALLGYYAFAVAVAGLAASFAWVIRTVIFPDVYGRTDYAGAGTALRMHLDQTLLPFARLYPPLLGAVALAIGPAVALLLPRYAEAVAPARLFIFTGTAFGFVSLGALGVIAAGRQRILPFFSALALVLDLGLAILALRSGAGLEGVAAGALLSQTVYGASILAITAAEAGRESPVRLVAGALVPLGWCAVVIFALGRAIPGTDPGSVVLSAVLYVISLLPLAPGMRRELRKLALGTQGVPRGAARHPVG